MINALDETSSIHDPATLSKVRNGMDYVKAFYAKSPGESIAGSVLKVRPNPAKAGTHQFVI
ncbi:MAG TPA: hypothetical protein VGQ72_10875 [Pyrinomonadaceae bacterium]|jgi:hypothetical protein|nr:hypothetical protein [Pyrinomonadaceae bacterium]